MWLPQVRTAIYYASRVGGMSVQTFVQHAYVSKYRARLIVKELADDKILIRRGNRYYYNPDNALAKIIVACAADMKNRKSEVK